MVVIVVATARMQLPRLLLLVPNCLKRVGETTHPFFSFYKNNYVNMNNIYLNQDPLLVHRTPDYANYSEMPMPNMTQLYNQFNREVPQSIVKDWIGELDDMIRGLEPSIVENLNSNKDFVELHTNLQGMIQDELMNLVKGRLNSYPGVIDNVKKQLNMIKSISSETKETERQNMNELNDYMKNYSHMTFDEYKKIKYGTTEESSPKNKKR